MSTEARTSEKKLSAEELRGTISEVVAQREKLREAHARLWKTLVQIATNEPDGERARWLAGNCLESEKERE
jgi:hypothetical protein